ncbi:MAG: hypothetical protein K1X85_14150 [Ignavibacteria bacterium]|nr:hypothetical protein [Ignavibacteria bacterium]
MVKKKSGFNSAEAHRHFSAGCFNRAWEFIDKKKRSPRDNNEMIATSFASLWHWMQRPDCSETNLSIGYWQLARVFALANEPHNALKYAKLCLESSKKKGVEPFYLAYAYEALARAEMKAKNRKKMAGYLEKALKLSEKIENAEYRGWLLKDLKTIK